MAIAIKSAADIEGMRVACRLASEVLDILAPSVRPGVTTEQLDQIAHHHMVDVQGTIPAPLHYAPPGYTPYPKSICTSINHQVCHGIPNERALKNGDIDRKSTRLNSSHHSISYAVFCLKKKKYN